MSRNVIRVGDDYDVVIGDDAWDDLPGLVGERAQRVLVVRAPTLPGPAESVRRALAGAGLEVIDAAVPDAEQAKTAEVAAGLWSLMGQHGFTRTDVVVGLGGGATTDLAGFVAATWLRGVPVVQVPTTLLAMVDAAVGGKTGINTAEGKNLVGAFHPPVGVLADLTTLRTLPRADLVAGMAEVVKCGVIVDTTILELVERDPAAALDLDGPVLRELVERAVQVKADVVAQDLRESSLREILNYGHTFGHAIEQVEHYAWRHGEAVAVGMIYVAELALRAGLLGQADVDRHRAVLTSLGLPTTYADGQWDDLLTAMRRDKKTRGSLLRFVALDAIGSPTRLEGPSEQQLRAAYDAVAG
ncbi:3-dehydroquinate synthase [Luteipulveratus halotolerans]|uniref:3-dehydroquinate synthase n=1 Tax=Luteipulveratus halotolerans TaxID=1631356 RepID=A0A0L6CHN8_9MICO|nr:3-dehydroquinate synthase [Luteipulveratus halotolerans]KNX37321.1 3-dehydroquinate synthase [Luteipulveratus halotolerans]